MENKLFVPLLEGQQHQFIQNMHRLIDTSINRSSTFVENQSQQQIEVEKRLPCYQSDYTEEEKASLYNFRRPSSMTDADHTTSFWMNPEETKFVTIDEDQTLKLFYLPYVLKCEMSRSVQFKNFKITKIAFSYNEKKVIIGSYDNQLAVADIESIEELFTLTIEEMEERFKDTIIKVEEKIEKVVIISNTDLIVIADKCDIYNLGRFNFTQKFKQLNAIGQSISLKKDFSKVIIKELGLNISTYIAIEQYQNLLFFNDKKKLSCYNNQTGKLVTFKSNNTQDDEGLAYLEFNNCSFIYNDNEIIIKEGLIMKVFSYEITRDQFKEVKGLGELDNHMGNNILIKQLNGLLYLKNEYSLLILNRDSLLKVNDITSYYDDSVDYRSMNRQLFRKSPLYFDRELINTGNFQELVEKIEIQITSFYSGEEIKNYVNLLISKFNYKSYSQDEINFLEQELSGFNVIHFMNDSVLVRNKSEINVIFIREIQAQSIKYEYDEGNESEYPNIFRFGVNRVIFSDASSIYCVFIPQSSTQQIQYTRISSIQDKPYQYLKISDNAIMLIDDQQDVNIFSIAQGSQEFITIQIAGIKAWEIYSYDLSGVVYRDFNMQQFPITYAELNDEYQRVKDSTIQLNKIYLILPINSELSLRYNWTDSLYLQERKGNTMLQFICPFKIYLMKFDEMQENEIYIQSEKREWYKLNLLKEGQIPFEILNKQEGHLKYDIQTKTFQFYESFEKLQQHQLLASIKIRSQFNSIMDFEEDYDGKQINQNQDVIKYIEEHSLSDILSYSTSYRKDFLSQSNYIKDIMEALLKKLALHQDDTVFLFPQAKNFSETPFDFCDTWMIAPLIKIMIAQDSRGLLYNEILYKNKKRVIQQGIELKSYFESSLVFHQITSGIIQYPEYHCDETEHLVPANYNSLFEISFKYNEIFKPLLVNSDNDQYNEENEKFEMNYFAIQVEKIIFESNKNLAKQIQTISDNDITYLDIDSLQVIIDFKWRTYTRGYYMKWFFVFLVFVAALLFDFTFCQSEEETCKYTSKGICGVIVLCLLTHEVQQIRKQVKVMQYFSEYWNIFDLLLIVTYIVYIILTFTYSGQTAIVMIKTIQCMIVLLTFIKLTFFMRIFEDFSFLVQMLTSVFKDLRFFLLFFSMFIITFAVLLSILNDETRIETYNDTGPFAFFLMAFRTSIGDNEMGDFLLSQEKLLAWFIWLVIMIVGNMIFMNFIIAVVNESYENCMSKMTAQKFKVKVDMIVERESMMSYSELNNPEWFPKYIVLRRKVNRNQNSGEWQGFVKEIKNNFDKSIAKVQAAVIGQSMSQNIPITDLKKTVVEIQTSVAALQENQNKSAADNKAIVTVLQISQDKSTAEISEIKISQVNQEKQLSTLQQEIQEIKMEMKDNQALLQQMMQTILQSLKVEA